MATAQINYVRIDHNMWVSNTKGMIIHVGFDVQGLAGQAGQAAAYFNYWQGAPLRDFDAAYKTEDGHVAVSENFMPTFDATNYADLQLFMPYEQLHMASGPSYLMTQIKIWDRSQVVPKLIAQSAWVQFEYIS